MIKEEKDRTHKARSGKRWEMCERNGTCQGIRAGVIEVAVRVLGG